MVDYRALEADHPAFSAVAAYQTSSVTVTDGGVAERVTAKSVTGSYFPLLGQTALLGRVFDPADDGRGDNVAVLTAAYWTRRFGGDPAVLGRPITIDGASYTIVGVLQKVTGPLEQNVAMFTAARWPVPKRKGPFFTMALGRLRPDVSRAAALDTLRATNARLFPIWKSSYQDEKATWGLQDLKARVVGEVGSTLLIVLAAVGCVLLIACANAMNLLIARALNRGREIAIRSALGASRGRLLQYLMVESGVLTASAAIVGLGVAGLAVRLVTVFGVGYVPRVEEVTLSGASLGWLAALAIASGLLILVGGLVPSIHGAWRRMDSALRSGGRSATDGPAARRLRRALVSAEFALATPLIVAAVLVMLSLDRLSQVSVGIDTERVLTGGVSLSGPAYARDADRQAFWERAIVPAGGAAGRRVRRARRQPPACRQRQPQQLRSRRSTDAGWTESACLHVGRRVAAVFPDRRPAARPRQAARRVLAARRRRRRRPRVGQPVLPRRGSPRTPVPERRLHHVPLDDRRRRRWQREMDGSRRDRGRHGLLAARRSVPTPTSCCGRRVIRRC